MMFFAGTRVVISSATKGAYRESGRIAWFSPQIHRLNIINS